eukprot:8764253-Ditylum_brightwellii.AAC.1
MGYDLEDLGTHSICRGATTYASSGTTASPGDISISIWGGWTMGKVQDTYMLHKKAGDQNIGRLLTGLPVMSHLFAASHPQFTCLNSGGKEDTSFISCQTVLDTTVGHAVIALFSGLSLSFSARIIPTLQVGLAPLFHNHQWLLDNVPKGTEVRYSSYFCLDELESLSKEVNYVLPGNDGVHCYLQCATAINSLVEKQLYARNIGGAIVANAMKAIIQQELLPFKETMERANTSSLEAVRESVEPQQHEEIIKGDHAESGCELFKFWYFSSYYAKLEFPCLLTPCHVAILGVVHAN